MPSMPADEICAERARLAEELAHAVSDIYARSREYQDARDRKENPEQISIALSAARTVERAAVQAYDDPHQEHGCKL